MEHSVKPSRRSLLAIMLAMTGVAIMVLIGMLLLSNFPGEPEGTTNKTCSWCLRALRESYLRAAFLSAP